MKTFSAVIASILLLKMLPTLLAADKPNAVDVHAIKNKMSITLGQEFGIEFKRDGNGVQKPSKSKETDSQKPSFKIGLKLTSASPVPPPRKGATRPYLSIENNSEDTLSFRALVRLKGSKEFLEITKNMERVPAGETFNKCWGFDSLVEEVVIYELALSENRAR